MNNRKHTYAGIMLIVAMPLFCLSMKKGGQHDDFSHLDDLLREDDSLSKRHSKSSGPEKSMFAYPNLDPLERRPTYSSRGPNPIAEANFTIFYQIIDALEADNQMEAMKLIEANKGLIDQQNQFGETMLHVAARKGHVNAAQRLLDLGARCMQNNADQFPVEVAVQVRQANVVRVFTDRGHSARLAAKPKLDEEYMLAAQEFAKEAAGQRTSLCNAIRHRKIVDFMNLLQDPRAATMVEFDGTTPLHVTVREWNPFMIKMLVGAGANIYAEDDLGNTPLLLAHDQGPTFEQYLLEEHQAYLSKERSSIHAIHGIHVKKPMSWKKAAAIFAGTGFMVWAIQKYLEKREKDQKSSKKIGQ